jgi:signal transduction histidine kinase
LEELRAHVGPVDANASEDRGLVLVVEDNVEMNRFITETLGSDYRTAVAFDGEEGLRKARELQPDLVVSDVMMPSMAGDQLVREIRRAPALDRVPILVLTAKADDELRIRMLQQGAHDYVMKPFSGNELRARVANLVKMKRARDLLQRELEHQGEDLEVLAREVTARHRELATTLQAMRVARDQAERASQVKTTFLGLVSHELRTPITALGLQMERLRRDLAAAVSPRQRDLLERMAAAVNRLTSLIESLLEHAQIESGRLALTLQTFDPRVLARETVEELRPRADQKGLELQLTTPDDLAELESDPRLFRLILVNLVENAIKYTRAGRIEVTLSADPASHTHRMTVSDTGPGIPPDMHGRVFEPFVQLEDIRKKHLPGVGLGLRLVKEMTEALGGRVQLDSTVGAGTTFTIHIPVRPATDHPVAGSIPREV